MVGVLIVLLTLGAGTTELRMVDAAGEPIAEAILELIPAETAGDPIDVPVREGRAVLGRPGAFDFVVRADGYATVTGSLRVPNDLGPEGNTIRLPREAVLSGRVVDTEGKPVVGARLSLLPAEGEAALAVLRTGARGRFSARALESGLVRLRVEAEGHLSETLEGLALREGRTLLREVRLHPATSLRIRVKDAAGKPLAGAKASVVTAGADARRLGTVWAGRLEELAAETGKDGAANLGPLPRGRTLRVAVRHPAHAPQSVRVTPAAAEAKAELQLKRGGGIRCLLRDGAKEPVAGARLHLSAAEVKDLDLLGDPPPSGADGGLNLDHLPAGGYVLRIQAAGLRPRTVRDVQVPEDGTADLGSLELFPGASIAGVVHDKAGTPVGGATVTARFHEEGRELTEEAESDAQGRFRLEGLPQRAVALRAEAEGYSSQEIPRVPAGREDVAFRLAPTGAVMGRVVEAGTGAPVVSFRLTRTPRRPDRLPGRRMRMRGEPVQDPDGRFRLEGLAEGDWVVHVQADGYKPGHSETFAVLQGEEAEAGEIALDPGLALEGSVEAAADGAPVAGATVGVGGYGLLGGPPTGVLTDTEGRFRLEGLESPTAIGVYHPDFVAKTVSGVNVLDSPFLTVRLERGGRVEGTVFNAAGEPQPGAEVRAAGKSSITDGAGHYALEGLAPGPLPLTKVDLPGTIRGQDRAVVRIQAGETARHDFGAGARLSGRLTWRAGPAPGAKLTLRENAAWSGNRIRGDLLRSREARTREDGRYVFPGLGEGGYTLTVEWEGRRFGRDVRMGSESRTLDIAVPDLEITGRVVEDTTEEPVPGAEVTAFLAEENRPISVNLGGRGDDGLSMWATAPLATDVSDTQGRFRLLVGQEGTWRLSARKEGYNLPRGQDRLTFQVKEAVRDVTVRLKGSATLRVRVLDGSTGAPLTSGFAEVHTAQGGTTAIMVMNLDAAGSVTFSDVPPEEVTVVGTADSFAPEWRRFEMEAGELSEEVLKLDRGGGLRLLLPEGVKATPDSLSRNGLQIQAPDGMDLTRRLLGGFSSNPTAIEVEPGVALLAHVPDGLLRVRLGGEGKPLAERSREVAVPLGGEVTADLR